MFNQHGNPRHTVSFASRDTLLHRTIVYSLTLRCRLVSLRDFICLSAFAMQHVFNLLCLRFACECVKRCCWCAVNVAAGVQVCGSAIVAFAVLGNEELEI